VRPIVSEERAMPRTRRDVWNVTKEEGDWPEVLRAYERAVGTMRALDPPGATPDNPLGWRFQAAIHGIADAAGNPDTSNALWCNCQHGSWYFLPWHRMYLWAFESIVQHFLSDESWSLPYWYSIDPDDSGKAVVPPAFRDTTLDDNNLHTDERSQNANAGVAFHGAIDFTLLGETVIAALRAAHYTTPTGQETFGGGERADLSFNGGERGLLENIPHGLVHSLVGNDYDADGNLLDAGWMGSFYTAGLDPLFWLHHANVDRLWDVWLRLDPAHSNPSGDPAFFDTRFTFPAPEGGTVTWSIGDVLDTAALGYVYESLAPPSALTPPAPPDVEPVPVPEDHGGRPRGAEAAVSESMPPRVMGAADDVPLASPEPVTVQMAQSRSAADVGPPARAFLRIEGVTGTTAAALYSVYINVPEGESPEDHPELRAGLLSTFGLVETSRTDDQHDGEGLTTTFDITGLRDRLMADGRWDDARADVRFVTNTPAPPGADAADAGGRAGPTADARARRVAIVAG
jgi:tyrosinase